MSSRVDRWPTDTATGKVSLRPGVVRKQAEIAEDLATLQAVEKELGPSLRTTNKHDALQENARFLREKLVKLEAGDSDELHRQLLAEIHDLVLYVGDTSNLILDPDLDSYYLMDAIVSGLVRGQDLLARSSSLSRSIVRGKTPKVEERMEFVSLASLAAFQSGGDRSSAGHLVPEQSRGKPESRSGAGAA